MNSVTPSSQPTKLDTQPKLPCSVFGMRYTCHCLRVNPRSWSSSTCQLLSTPSATTHSFKIGSVSVSQTVSDCFKLNFGVPQCSLLGPWLFSIYNKALNQVMSKYMDVKYHFILAPSCLTIYLLETRQIYLISSRPA